MQKKMQKSVMITGAILVLSAQVVAAESVVWEPAMQFSWESEHAEEKLAILYTGNTRGKGFEEQVEEGISIASLYHMKNELKEAGYEVLLLDSGDCLQGTVFVNQTKGAGAIEFMNAVGYDAMVLGSHELDWGKDCLLKNADTAEFPFLASNLYVEDELLFPAFQILETENGWKVGILGVADATAGSYTIVKNDPELFFAPEDILYEELNTYVTQMRDSCELLICMGYADAARLQEENAACMQDIDIILSGSCKASEQYLMGETLFSGTGQNMEAIGIILLEDGLMKTGWVTADLYLEKDMGLSSLIYEKQSFLKEQLSSVVGVSAVDFKYQAGEWEFSLGDLIADAVLWQGKKLSGPAVNASVIRGAEIQSFIKKGDLNGSTFYDVLPEENSLCLVTLTGTELQELLANLSYSVEDCEWDYFQTSGITCQINPCCEEDWENEASYRKLKTAKERITIESIGFEAFDEEMEYQIVISEDLLKTWALDESLLKKYEKNGVRSGIFVADALANYVAENLSGMIDDAYEKPRERIVVKES